MANWIQGAIQHPGALHRELGVPMGQKIPEKKLSAASAMADKEGNTKMKRQIALARRLKAMHG